MKGLRGQGGFSRRDWYSSRAFNQLPSGPQLATRLTTMASLHLGAISKLQNGLRSAFTEGWAMMNERCASSGRQGKRLVESVLSEVQRLAVERRTVRRVMSSS
jgi:hypothetical protein